MIQPPPLQVSILDISSTSHFDHETSNESINFGKLVKRENLYGCDCFDGTFLILTPGEMGLIPHLLSSVNPPTTSPSSLAPGETTPPTGPTGEIPYLLGSSE